MDAAVRDQVDWESRWAKPAAAAAVISVLFDIATIVVGRIPTLDYELLDEADDNLKILTGINDHSGAFLASAAFNVLSLIALAGVLFYLSRAVLARRLGLPRPLVWLGVIGALLYAAASVLTAIHRVDAADQLIAQQFTHSLGQLAHQADQMIDDSTVPMTFLGFVGQITLAIAFIFISINAMRVGLMTRLMGTFGVIIGVLYVIPLLAGPVMQMLWLLALGVLFLGRWPGGRGLAWETGEAIEWSPASVRALDNDDQGGGAPTTNSPAS